MNQSNYKRYIPPLANPATLPYPANVIRLCRGCDLVEKARSPVPGFGLISAQVMLVGENPGENENLEGRPFIGKAGKQLDSLLVQCGIYREDIYITNKIKCFTTSRASGRTKFTADQISACSHWLDLEISLVDPRIIVAMGETAIRHFIGDEFDSVEKLHGRPVYRKICGAERILLPCYHPAAALHQTNILRFLQDDFQVLKGLLNGSTVADYTIIDEYPNPDYRVLDLKDTNSLNLLKRQIKESGEYGVDTEQVAGKLWSVQISAIPGTGWFIPIKDSSKKFDLSQFQGTPIVHYYQHDSQFLVIDDNNFVDSMTQAYLCSLPQGLKELASRLCGMSMASYQDCVRGPQRKLSLQYLTKATKHKWPDPPIVDVVKWDNKVGKVVVKNKKPKHISTKIKNRLAKIIDDVTYDILDKWNDIPQEERDCVEKVLGVMPESSLADIPFEEAVAYSTRDADSTLRVKHKLDKLIEEMGLSFVLNMDLGILPMVRDMMANGMAVDVEHFRRLSKGYAKRMADKAAELAKIVGHPFNPGSRPQVAKVIYEELGFKPTAFTDSHEISTDDQELKKTGHPVAKGIIEYRRMSKMKGTYSDNIANYALPEPDGHYRIHTTIKTTRTDIGRLSSGDPINLQNQPVRGKEALAIQNGYKAPKGRVKLAGDLGQIEMRTQAHLAKCKGLIDLFLRGDDPHTVTASKIFDVPYEEAKQDKYRYPCKRAGFGIIYMMGAIGLSKQIMEYVADLLMEGETVEVEPWDVPTCDNFITEYFRLYPEIRVYQQEQAAHARRFGYVKDLFGRIKYIPEVMSPISSVQETGTKMAAHMPVSATAQGVIKLAMNRAWQEYIAADWHDKVRWEMQVHDSLLVELPEDGKFIRGFADWLGGIMTNSVKLLVPITVDFKAGKTWGTMEKLKKE